MDAATTGSRSAGPLGLDDPRRAWQVIAALLVLYLVGFACFYPRVVMNVDESQYVHQTLMLLEGRSTIEVTDPLTGETFEKRPSTYPIGTALLMAPWVASFGWRGAFLVAPIALVLAVVMLGRWLQENGRSPLFSLLLFGFVPTLVMSRLAMSDMPSAAMVTLGLWLFWRGREGPPQRWLLAGFVFGASTALRPPNALTFLLLCAGTVIRWDRHWWALAIGGVAGSAVRLASSAFVLGDPFTARNSYLLELHTIGERLPLFLFGLLVLIPGGLVLSLLYRGDRRPEIVGTIVSFFVFFVFQRFSTVETSLQNRIVLALRYFLPLLPLMVFAMAESGPRLWNALQQRLEPTARDRTRRLAAVIVAGWLVGLGLASFGVHWFLHSRSARLAEMRETIVSHVEGRVIVTNWSGTGKFLPDLDLEYAPLDRRQVEPAVLVSLAKRYDGLLIVLLDRTDSEWFRNETAVNATYIDRVEPEPELLLDRRFSPTERLRIWQMSGESN